MSTQALTRFIAVAKLVQTNGEFDSDKHDIIAFAASDKRDSNLRSYKKHIIQIMKKGAARISAGKRIRLTSDENDYDLFVTAYNTDGEILAFFVIVDPKFGANHSMAKLFEEFKTGFFKVVEPSVLASSTGSNGKAQKKCDSFFTQLLQRYSDSKLADVQHQVDEIKLVMADNISNVLQNVEQLEDMEDRADNLQRQGQVFADTSGTLRDRQRCAYYKTNALIFLVICVILAIITIPIVIASDSSK